MTPRHTLHIVSGKGGTGKTTIAAGLACALATSGRRVLLCEVEGRNGHLRAVRRAVANRTWRSAGSAVRRREVRCTAWRLMPRTP